MSDTNLSLDVALCQYRFSGADSVTSLCERVRTLFDRAEPADVYVLPELIGYDLAVTNGRENLALTGSERDALHEQLAAEARERTAVIVGGSYRIDDRGTLYNRAPTALPDGTVRTYDKQRPVPAEREAGVAPGTDGGPVIEHEGVSIGVLICYDTEFPTVVREVVDRGAEVLAVPSLTAGEGGFQRVSRCSAARAVENQVYVAQVPLVGVHPHGDKQGTGRSSVYAPCDDVVGASGTRLTLPRDEHTSATDTLDIERLRQSRSEATVRPYSDRDIFEHQT